MKKTIPFLLALLAPLLLRAAEAPPAGFATPVTAGRLDPAAYAEWADGAAKPIVPVDAKDRSRRPDWVLYTDATVPGHSGFKFGDSAAPGPRHLCIGFTAALPAGAVFARGGGRVSALKPDAPYPGDPADEAQWLPAQRIVDGRVSQREALAHEYALWTLPPGLRTRALRFTHAADVADKTYAGFLEGACLLAECVANIAPQAVPSASANTKAAPRLIDGSTNPTWEQWSNVPLKDGARAGPVSASSPEWVLLVWREPVQLRGIGLGYAGFGEAEAQIYAGPKSVHPREAPADAWQTAGRFTGLRNRYPSALEADWLDFGRTVETRALRLRLTAPMPEGGHPHVAGHTRNGTRVWIGELLALAPVDRADLKNVLPPAAPEEEQPPIPVSFRLPEDGWVTLVIEDAAGRRVRNLIADAFLPKGAHEIGWDGSDDLGRDPAAAAHGIYRIPTHLVEPGRYNVRGLWRKQVDLKYEMGVYNAGRTPWETADKSGGWLANHTPPSSALFVPDAAGRGPSVLLGSYVSEGGAGLAWVDLDGHKWKGQNWVGGTWTGAPYLTRDAGPRARPGIYAYAAAAWEAGGDGKGAPIKGEIRITGLTAGEDQSIAHCPLTPSAPATGHVRWEEQIGGFAAWDGVLAVGLSASNRVLFVDAKSGAALGETALESPRGLAFDPQGRLVALSGRRLVRFAGDAAAPAALHPPEVLADGLEDPAGLAIDAAGNLFVSDRGRSQQVKSFSPAGKFLRAIGRAGPPRAGPYDPLHMNSPRGLSVDARGRLWVAEEDAQPKRVSLWNADGTLAQAFYGPAEYGGGGAGDPKDPAKFYYHGMEFRLDRAKGVDELVAVYYRPGPDTLELAFRAGLPQTAVYAQGRRYFHDAFNSNPTGGHGTTFLFVDRDGIAVPVAAAGRANEWELLKGVEFKASWPAGTDPAAHPSSDKAAFFLWSDRNGDGRPQPEEVAIRKAVAGGVTVMPDLSIVVARLDGRAVCFAPQRFTAQGAPEYDLNAARVLVAGAQNPPSSGGDQVLVGPDGWTVHTTAPAPFDARGLGGARNGVPTWSYPSLWPGLHASHESPVPDRPGEVIGHTRLLGGFITPRGGEPLWLLNGNHGPMYVFTLDGLFVAQLFQDMRVGRPWQMPVAQRGMKLNDVTPGDENFWPSVTQTPDGAVTLAAGGRDCLVRVEGLETVRRLPARELKVAAADVDRAREYYARREAARQAAQGRGELEVALRAAAPAVDGRLDDWAAAEWAEVDQRGVAAYFNAKSRPYDVTAAVAIAGERLYAAWRTEEPALLKNAGDVPLALFKTGGALDLMIGADPAADPKRTKPAAGDERLLVTQVGGKTRALLYRAVVREGRQPVPFSSPGRTILFDRVDDVSDRVQLAADGGNFELSVPLAVLGLQPAEGQTLRGDIGLLRGAGGATTERVYWSNKATAIVADVPSEAELRPNLWGRFRFHAAP